MSVQDLTNTTWVWNEIIDGSTLSPNPYNVNFTSNNNTYNLLDDSIEDGRYIFYGSTCVYDGDTGTYWSLDAYKTLSITGGTDVTNASLISWLEQNATQQLPIKLSNTMWRFSDTPTLSNVGTFDLDFTSNNIDYNSLTIASDRLSYGDTLAYGSTGYDVSCSLTWPEDYGEDWVGCVLSISGTGCITDPSDFDGDFTYGETVSRAFNADGQVVLTISSILSVDIISASFNGNTLTFTPSPPDYLTYTATINVTQNSTLTITAYGYD